MSICPDIIIDDFDNIPAYICYKYKLTLLQQKYTTLVNNYLVALQYGTICITKLEDLKMFRRMFTVLKRYDTRDIENDTLVYNAITYTNIKTIVNTLSDKY